MASAEDGVKPMTGVEEAAAPAPAAAGEPPGRAQRGGRGRGRGQGHRGGRGRGRGRGRGGAPGGNSGSTLSVGSSAAASDGGEASAEPDSATTFEDDGHGQTEHKHRRRRRGRGGRGKPVHPDLDEAQDGDVSAATDDQGDIGGDDQVSPGEDAGDGPEGQKRKRRQRRKGSKNAPKTEGEEDAKPPGSPAVKHKHQRGKERPPHHGGDQQRHKGQRQQGGHDQGRERGHGAHGKGKGHGGGGKGGGKGGHGSHGRDGHKQIRYATYWTPDKVSAGLKRGELVRGPIRINSKRYTDAYIVGAHQGRDVFVDGMAARNRALEGDFVVAKLLPRSKWQPLEDEARRAGVKVRQETQKPKIKLSNLPAGTVAGTIADFLSSVSFDHDSIKIESHQGAFTAIVPLSSTKEVPKALGLSGQRLTTAVSGPIHVEIVREKALYVDFDEIPDHLLRPCAEVVYIESTDREYATFAGSIRLDEADGYFLFQPKDARVPRILIPNEQAPDDFFQHPKEFNDQIFMARITDWEPNSVRAHGSLVKLVGAAGNIEVETEAILAENGVDTRPFGEEVLACLPEVEEGKTWPIPEAEVSRRRDLRSERIFTIDPPTSRDLDDAVSCKLLDDGTYEMGVHIADVSYFVVPDTALDEMASKRCTTTYMTQRAYAMLPRLLCEQLCSLNPAEDRLAFSVIWKMNEEGEILDEWFGRTVMHSCAKLSYDHAQTVIENPDVAWVQPEFPELVQPHTPEQVKEDILRLDRIAKNLRRKRFKGGALRLNKPKLSFRLDDDGMPTVCKLYEQRDSNKLIEEFMLLANMAVARRIYNAFPQNALLRRHPAPLEHKVEELVEMCNILGISVDAKSSADLQRSLYAVSEHHGDVQFQILQLLFAQPMQVARYFCTGEDELDFDQFRHYALNVPLYTHFTSPIRRYADVIVHRLLEHALQEEPLGGDLATDRVTDISKWCNSRKEAAKKAQDASLQLFACVYIERNPVKSTPATVFRVLDRSFDVLVPEFGLEARVYCEQLPVRSFAHNTQTGSLILEWNLPGRRQPVIQNLSVFSQVHVELQVERVGIKSVLKAQLLAPTEEDLEEEQEQE